MTGGAGFVGAHVVRALARRRTPVIAADLAQPPPPVLDLWSGLPVTFRRLDVRDAAAVRALLEDVRPPAVVHAAAVTNAAEQRSLDEVNVGGTAAVLKAAGTARIVCVSSASVYASGAAVQQESSPVRQDADGYPASKLAAEALATAAGAVIARVAACFGPLERDTGVRRIMSLPHAAVHAVLDGRAVGVEPESANRSFDPTWVGDVAEALATLAMTEELPHRLFNVGSGQEITLRALADAVTAVGGPPRHHQDPLLLRLPDGHRTGRLDVSRLRQLPVPQPLPLVDALSKYLGWLREHRN